MSMDSAGSSATRRQVWSCAAVLVAAALFLHHEVLWGGMVYHMDDAAIGYYPSHVAALRAIRAGELPTWERGSWSGWPLLADPYYAFFYPLTALFYVIGPVKGLGVAITVHVLLAAFGMFWLCRRRGLSPGPALLAAVSLGFSSFMVVRIRHIIFPQGLAWIPILLASIEGWLMTGRRRELVLTAAACAMILVSGAIPLVLFFAILAAAYVVPRIVERRTAQRWRRCGGLLVAGVIGVLLAMAQVVPTLAHLSESPRALGADYAFSSTYAWPGIRYLVTLVAPEVRGTEATWFGPYNHWELAGYYSGALTMLLAPFGLMRRERAERWTLFAAALLGIGLALGDAGPFHRWFFQHVPLYATLRAPTRALVMTLVAVPILAADGLAWLSARAAPSRHRVALAGALMAFALVPVAWLRLTYTVPGTSPQQLQMIRSVAQFAMVVGCGVSALLLLLGSWMPRRTGELAVALIVLADLLVVGRGSVQPRPADWAAGTERYAAVDWLLEQHPADRFVADARGPSRFHNLGMTYGPALEAASGYDSFGIWRYVAFLWAINNGTPYPHPTLKDDLAVGVIRRFGTPWVDFLNIRWVIAPVPPGDGWIERFRLESGASPHARYEEAWDRALRVYENPNVLPRAFVVYHATVIAADGDQAAALGRVDPRSTVILDRAPTIAPDGDHPFTPATRFQADRHLVTVNVETSSPGILVTSEPAYPGWSASIDGQPAPLLRANYAFRGVALPPGRHVVELRFVSRPAEAGLALSACGVVSLVALGLAGRRRSRAYA